MGPKKKTQKLRHRSWKKLMCIHTYWNTRIIKNKSLKKNQIISQFVLEDHDRTFRIWNRININL